ncbi:MAG TPA: AAA family ATPase [Steroidobacteraceae bacterium]|nr:AAA family ATPase [Steroidobacteraceae bacterium]
MSDATLSPIPVAALRWRCPVGEFAFATTAELPEVSEALGQERATEALRFGARVSGPNHHVYAMGDAATDRLEVVLHSLAHETNGRPTPRDWCCINRFDDPRRPRVLVLPAGRGAELKRDMHGLIEELGAALPAAFESEGYRSGHAAIDHEFEEREQKFLAELQADAEGHRLGLVRTPQGFAIAPVREGAVLPPEEFNKLPEPERREALAQIERLSELLRKHLEHMPEWVRERLKRVRDLNRQVTELAIRGVVGEIKSKYAAEPAVSGYLAEVERDLVENAELFRQEERPSGPFAGLEAGERALGLRRYDVNVLVDNSNATAPPVVYEPHPSYQNLLGRVEHASQFGTLTTDFTMIRAGALQRANGGYLVIEAMRLLAQPYAWEALKRALLTREARIESLGEMLSLVSTTTLEPEPVPLEVRVVLVGPRLVHHLLAALDEDFPALFSIVADFADTVQRTPQALQSYAALLGTLARSAGLKPLERGAVARFIEESLRATGDASRLSASVRETTALLREADYLAGESGRGAIAPEDVARAVAAQVRRLDRIRELYLEETVRNHVLIDTAGARIGAVNGLSVVDSGGFAFGHPSCITATARMGEGEVVDIEREVELGGAIHSKGVLILSSFVGARYAPRSPLSLHASLVFEQTYGGVDGDSASLAECCALLSALAHLPIRQSIAVTGSINQHGTVQVVGGLNEKIEGFFDLCARRGLTGEQGVLIPAQNVQHLMLRDDVVQAAQDGRFQIYTVRSVDEAMAFLTGSPAGERDASTGQFPPGSVNRRVEDQLLDFAQARRTFVQKDGVGATPGGEGRPPAG